MNNSYIVSSINASGDGVLRIDGKVHFAPAALTLDKIQPLKIVTKKNFNIITDFALITPSPLRKSDLQAHHSYYQSLGMPLYPLQYRHELAHKQALVFETIHRISKMQNYVKNPIIYGQQCNRYRNKGVFPVYPDPVHPRIGVFLKGSRDIYEPDHFELMPESFEKIIAITKEFIKMQPHKFEGLRFLVIRKGHDNSHLIGFSSISNHQYMVKDYVDMLRASGIIIRGIIAIKKSKDDGQILEGKVSVLHGENKVTEQIAGKIFQLRLESFFQVNPVVAGLLYEEVRRLAAPEPCDEIWDIYAGVGSIGISLAADAGTVRANEILEGAVFDAERNKFLNHADNVHFEAGRAEDVTPNWISAGHRPSKIILDPPRKGVSPNLLKQIANLAAKSIIYVSCNPSTLARDIGVLAAFGYRLKEITPADLFPGTSHVETVALLSKLDVDKHISVEVTMDELDLTSAESKATYKQIKEYIIKNTGLKVSSLNIAQIKRKYGIVERKNYNKAKNENSKAPACTEEKENAIVDALKYFQMI